jgi:hypothetical protein
MSTSVFTLLRRTKFLRIRIRRSIVYAFMYSFASGFCHLLHSWTSASCIWLAFAEVATVVLVERIHLRWSHSIVLRTPRTKSALAYPWRSLLLPTMLHVVAQKLVAEVPDFLESRFASNESSLMGTLAARDVIILASASTLSFLVL